jgi:hypothetical protein
MWVVIFPPSRVAFSEAVGSRVPFWGNGVGEETIPTGREGKKGEELKRGKGGRIRKDI